MQRSATLFSTAQILFSVIFSAMSDCTPFVPHRKIYGSPVDKKRVFRADSDFFNGALFDLFERFGHEYLVKVKLKNPKEHLSQWMPEKNGANPSTVTGRLTKI